MQNEPNGIEAKISIVTGLLAEISASSFITMKGLEDMASAVKWAKAAFMAGQAEDRRAFDAAMEAHVAVLEETRGSMILVAESADKLFAEREATLTAVLDGVTNSLLERAWHVRTGENRIAPASAFVTTGSIEPEELEDAEELQKVA